MADTDDPTDPESARAHREFLHRLTRNWPQSLEARGLPTFDELTKKMTEDALSRPLLSHIYRIKGA